MTGEKLNQNPDSVGGSRTIYDANSSEIFWKNFLAGLGRGFGMFIFNVILFVIIGGFFFSYAWPLLQPMLQSFERLTQSVEQIQDINSSFSNDLPSIFGGPQ